MIIIANWKAYVEELEKAKRLFELSKRLSGKTVNTLVIAPPAPFLGAFALHNKSKVAFSAQDVSVTTGGAKTGEATAHAYAAAGATYALVGHSERRAMGDTNAIVAEKLIRVLAHKLTPVLCIGEQERDSEGRYLMVVREELTTALVPLTPKERTGVIIAYEPIWAIGKTARDAINPNDLTEMVLYIRKILAEFLPGKNSLHSLVLYGGSVEPNSIRDLAIGSGIDGFLVGHSSVDLETFKLLIKQLG